MEIIHATKSGGELVVLLYDGRCIPHEMEEKKKATVAYQSWIHQVKIRVRVIGFSLWLDQTLDNE
jgi:hypothetical protein